MSKRVTTSFRVSREAQMGVVSVTPRVIPSGPTPEPPAAAQPNGVVLTDNTSLDDLFTAILGGDAREQDDRGPLLEAVDAQVSRLRKELGLVEPPPPPPPAAPKAIQELRDVETPLGTAAPGGPAVWLRRRFEALRQGMPDVWSSVPRPVMLGLPVMALVVAGAIWLGAADSRPREVAAAAAPAPVAPTASPALTAPVAPAAAPTIAPSAGAPTSSNGPVSTPSAAAPSVPAASSTPTVPAPERAREARGRVSRGGADENIARAASASAAPSAARPVSSASSSLVDVASPAAPTAAAGSRPTAAPSSVASPAAVAPPFAANTVATPAPLAVRADAPAAAAVAATPVAPVAAPEPTPAPRDNAAASTAAPIPAPTAPPASVSPAASAASPAPATTASASATPVAPAPGTTASQPAVLLSRATPVYPEAARRARVTGTVEVILSIDKQGTVVRATAVDGSPLLRPSAEDAARKWRYRPEFVNGAPVETERRVRIVFQ